MLIEVILTAVILLLILVFVGVPLPVIISWTLIGLSAVLLLAAGLVVLFFSIASVSLLFFRRRKGVFLRMDDNGRFERAVYAVDGTEYTCLFPAENVGRRTIYREGAQAQPQTLFVSRSNKRRTVYDRHSLTIILCGSLFSVLLIVLGVYGVHLFQRFL